MQFEKIRRINKRKIIIGGVISLGVIGAISILPSFAKYRLTDSINIANGVVNYKVPDFQMVAMYKSDDGENYTEIDGRMPDSGYVINEEKSYCNLNGEKDTNAVLKTVDGYHVISNLIKGDKCYLYFDKKKNAADTILVGITINSGIPDFSKVATTDEGVFKTDDGMYGGNSYYWRGAVTNNYVKFAGFCWRIIRINGDGTMRLIYDGTTCHVNGTNTTESIAVTSQPYNSSDNRSEYVGYTYTQGSQRGDSSASNLKNQTENWYITNITDKGYDEKVTTGKFCNDRELASGYSWNSQPSNIFYYAARGRLESSKEPILSCSNNDIYSLKVGAITADEVSFSGGVVGKATQLYYLYNGQNYWTMSPSLWYYDTWEEPFAIMFYVANDGMLHNNGVHNTYGIRPVINLRSDITFSSGDGTLNNPFVVS